MRKLYPFIYDQGGKISKLKFSIWKLFRLTGFVWTPSSFLIHEKDATADGSSSGSSRTHSFAVYGHVKKSTLLCEGRTIFVDSWAITF